MKTITKEKARLLSGNWHGGQWSQLYAFSSSGNCDYLQAINEVLECIYNQETSLHPYELPKYQVKELQRLKKYFEKQLGTVEYVKNFYGFEYAQSSNK